MKPIHLHNGNLPTEERGLEILLGLYPPSKRQQYKKTHYRKCLKASSLHFAEFPDFWHGHGIRTCVSPIPSSPRAAAQTGDAPHQELGTWDQ